MKNLILITLLFVVFPAAAQQNTDTKFKAEYTVDKATSEDLFLLAYDWTNTFFTGSGNTLISSKHSENKLEGKVNLTIEKESSDVDYSIVINGNTCTISFTQVSNPSEHIEQLLNVLIRRFGGVIQSELSKERKAELKAYQHKN